MSLNASRMGSSGTASHPLLVKVQKIDTQDLDFKTTSTFKPRNATCVETSNLLILVGVTSGTVYVFSRETRSFKYVIPFAGGKVCCISCSENEKAVAIGSIRGHVSIYELLVESSQISVSTNIPISVFRHITSLEFHKGNEITEMVWSSNGKFLFVGDSQGVVSQTDILSKEEIGRPMSQVIFKLKSRIIQIQFLFPFLAICTVSSVFLGDIENEDFARVQFENKVQIQATGLALIMSYVDPTEKLATMHLYVSEMRTGMLHRFNLQGQLLASEKIILDDKTQSPIRAFDPILSQSEVEFDSTIKLKETIYNSHVTLGKLLVSDENLLLSVSHNNLYVIEPITMKVMFWDDEFSKIQNSKLISNYIFLWSTSSIIVLSLTPILPYTLQLVQSGASLPFERWIQHCLHSLGWKSTSEQEHDNNQQAIHDFCSTLDLSNSGPNGEDFRKLISLHVPFDIPEEVEVPALATDVVDAKPDAVSHPLLVHLQNLLEVFEVCEAGNGDGKWNCSQSVTNSTVWKVIESFYTELIPSSSSFWSVTEQHQTLFKIMTAIERSWMDPSVVNLYVNLIQISTTKQVQLLNEKILTFLDTDTFSSEDSFCEDMPLGPLHLFSTFVRLDFVSEWFHDLGLSADRIYEDALYADFFLVLFPLLSPEIRTNTLLNFSHAHGFCVWLLLSTFYNFGQVHNPYELQLKSLFTTTAVNFQFVKTIFSSIYGDLVQSNTRPLQNTLHHLVSLVYFLSSSKDMTKQERISKKEDVFSLLISCFPLKHWARDKLFPKLTSLCKDNVVLLKMYEEACLCSERETKLCKCGIPSDCLQRRPSSQLGRSGMASFFTTVKEVVLEQRIEKYRRSTNEPFPFNLLMKTKLFERFWTSLVQYLDEVTLMDIILRTASCALLKEFPMSLIKIGDLLRRRDFIIKYRLCPNCSEELDMPSNFSSISMDCIGLTVYNTHCFGSMETFCRFIEDFPYFKVPGVFSLRFYQVIAAAPRVGWANGGRETQKRQTYGHAQLSCTTFHSE